MPAKGFRYNRYPEICTVFECTDKARHAGLCGKHYKRKWRHGDPETTLIDMEEKKEKCRIDGCQNVVYTHENMLCKLHYQRDYRYGRTENTRASAGEGYTNSDGYRLLSINGARIYEHIYLAEKALGKPLPPGAVVHHMNENKEDNFTPFNLIVCPNQSYHRLLHDRAKSQRLLYELEVFEAEELDLSGI